MSNILMGVTIREKYMQSKNDMKGSSLTAGAATSDYCKSNSLPFTVLVLLVREFWNRVC